ncbi:hypothetical protein F8388_011079 [Cannabis sativa]|uniref:Uncharacterized protein n=1 Tax=Cannabis sativa TaxID=3483 RepID=A0A7J6F5I0_CANSA|nr:hypothetical protein F8388_011079 [Cannabis sativa]
MNLSHQSSHVTHVSSSLTTPHDPSIIPFPSYLPISLPTNIPNSTPSFATYPPHTNLHYSSPPIINSTSLKQKGIMTDSTSISIPFSDITNNMPQSIAVPHINGPQYIDDNALGHNPASKRPIESESLRKFLKRCRSHNNGQSDTPATTDRSSASQAIQAVLDTIPELISRESQEVLSSPFTATEVYAALKSMSEDSSPGVDGISDRDVKVADFITHSRQWDVPKLQQFFTPPDVDRILSIPLSLFPCEDVLLWHYSSAGFYTLQAEKVELFLTTLWCIWTARNAETHSKSPKSALQIFQFASSYLAEFRKAQSKTNSAGTSFHVSPATSSNSAAESSSQLSHLKDTTLCARQSSSSTKLNK